MAARTAPGHTDLADKAKTILSQIDFYKSGIMAAPTQRQRTP